MGESVVFVLPDSREEALFSVPVLTQYLLIREVDINREKLDSVTIVCSLVSIHPFLKAAWIKANIVEELNNDILDKADLVIEFNPERAYKVTSSTLKHYSESIGILLGGFPMMLLPAIAQLNFKEDIGSVLVVDRSPLDSSLKVEWKFKDHFIKIGQASGIKVTELNKEASFEEIIEKVSIASVVVGVNSTATLVAASLGKILLEMTQQGTKHKNWLAKFEHRDYDLVYGDLDKMTTSYIWDRTQKLVSKCTKRANQWDSHQHPTLEQEVGVGE